jgi:hypothetical protein
MSIENGNADGRALVLPPATAKTAKKACRHVHTQVLGMGGQSPDKSSRGVLFA